MKFDADTLARGWLATAVASGTSDAVPQLNRTTYVEAYEGRGARLTCTDGTLLLQAWVISEDAHADSRLLEPTIDEAPSATAVVVDPDGRGRSLMGYLLGEAAKARRAAEDPPTVSLALGIVIEEVEGRPQFAGLETRYVTFDFAGKERLRLRCYEGTYPAWRQIVDGHHPGPLTEVVLNPELLARLGKAAKHHAGGWHFTFAGDLGACALDLTDSDPQVHGVLMPMRPAEPITVKAPDPTSAGDDAPALELDDTPTEPPEDPGPAPDVQPTLIDTLIAALANVAPDVEIVKLTAKQLAALRALAAAPGGMMRRSNVMDPDAGLLYAQTVDALERLGLVDIAQAGDVVRINAAGTAQLTARDNEEASDV